MIVDAINSVLTSPVSWNAYNLFNTINGIDNAEPSNIFNIINQSTQQVTQQDEVIQDPAWINIYLQWPNDQIKKLALKIVNEYDSDDIKMQKIQSWVVKNIQYQEDKDQYGYDELWVPPLMTLQSGSGDCEDGAFLIMSLALNAGVDPSRLRMYGGFVDAGEGAASGGHGWTAYQRESDNEWVAVDWCYYPDMRDMDYKIALKDDMKYVEDYFFITNQYVVMTDYSNRIREPDTYLPNGTLPSAYQPGAWLSVYA